MIRLLGHSVNDVLRAWWGPVTGRNYLNGAGNLAVYIQVFGSGSVSLEKNSTLAFKNVNNDPNKHSMEMHPAEGGWSAVTGGTAITAAMGIVKVAVSAGSGPNWLHIKLVDPGQGDGIVVVRSDWK